MIKARHDPQEAAEYLDAALEGRDPEAFIMALNNVAKAQSELPFITTQFKPENINKMFSEPYHSELYSFDALLHSLGFRLAIQRMS